LTLDGRTSLGELILKIPNLVIRKLYIERIQEMLVPDFKNRDEVLQIAKTFYSTGDIEPLCEFIEQKYFKVFDNRDYRWANELTVKTAFLTLLFNDVFYIMDSEASLERSWADEKVDYPAISNGSCFCSSSSSVLKASFLFA
jgi:hypothetical protein